MWTGWKEKKTSQTEEARGRPPSLDLAKPQSRQEGERFLVEKGKVWGERLQVSPDGAAGLGKLQEGSN